MYVSSPFSLTVLSDSSTYGVGFVEKVPLFITRAAGLPEFIENTPVYVQPSIVIFESAAVS